MDQHLAKPAANHRSYSGNRASAFRLVARGARHNRQYLFPGTQLRVPGRCGRLARLAQLPRRQRRDWHSLSLSERTDPARGREPDRRSGLHAGIAGGAGLECGTGDPWSRHRRAAQCRSKAFWRGGHDVTGRIFAAAADHRCRGRSLVVRRRAADAFARRTLRVWRTTRPTPWF